MSWEKINTRHVPCPCEKGILSQDIYEDDWKRTEEGPVIIECKECREKYKVEKEYYKSLKSHRGDWTNYWLVPNNYPEYNGVSVKKVYPTKTEMYNMVQRDFVEYLIITYDFNELIEARNNMTQNKAFDKIRGIARIIAKEYKRQFKSQNVKDMLVFVEKAITLYKMYEGNHENRKIVEEKEKQEYAAYLEEKKKHIIPVIFI